jgi:hypothetical protein
MCEFVHLFGRQGCNREGFLNKRFAVRQVEMDGSSCAPHLEYGLIEVGE